MKMKYLAGLAAVGLLALGLSVPADASLVVQGTVDYMGAARNLIYDDDLNITWLDYSNALANWSSQQSWAANLSLTVNGVTYDNWRLPNAGTNPIIGYNQTTSEMGHLFYTELGLLSFPARGNQLVTVAELNFTDFDNLVSSWYWSETGYGPFAYSAWNFTTHDGRQDTNGKGYQYSALAVLPGQIQVAAVPEPASMLLIGSGLAGLVGLKRRKK